MQIDSRRSVWRGFLAGAVGGVVGVFAMGHVHGLFQKAESPALEGKEDSTVMAASGISQGIFHHKLTPEQKRIAGPAMHYGFGASAAAIYGTAADFTPIVRAAWGIPFGVAVWLGAHVITVPALGLSEPITESAPRKEAIEFGAHLVYGAVAEGIRRFLRTHVLR